MLGFKSNLAVNKAVKGMPEKSFTVEFWARGKKLGNNEDMEVGTLCRDGTGQYSSNIFGPGWWDLQAVLMCCCAAQ
jgi:hypothetical protein